METPVRYLVLDGKIVPFAEAKLHISTPAVKYGATAFEGIRAYWNEDKQQLYVFRAREHFARLLQSGRLMGMQGVNYTADDMLRICIELLRINELRQDVHIRPSLFVVGDGGSQARGPVSFGIVVVPMKRWADKPYKVCVSSWRRIEDNIMSPRIKCAANYENGRLALIQAEEDGYDGVLMLDANGNVTEEPRACVFLVRNGVPITPRLTDDVLESVTRETLIQLFREQHGLIVQERAVDRTELYVADEVFLCGTGLEVTTVVKVDRFAVGDGKNSGPVTTAIRNTYMAITRGESDLHPEWRTAVY
jgi:branched-chain amino acid aminotransferase